MGAAVRSAVHVLGRTCQQRGWRRRSPLCLLSRRGRVALLPRAAQRPCLTAVHPPAPRSGPAGPRHRLWRLHLPRVADLLRGHPLPLRHAGRGRLPGAGGAAARGPDPLHRGRGHLVPQRWVPQAGRSWRQCAHKQRRGTPCLPSAARNAVPPAWCYLAGVRSTPRLPPAHHTRTLVSTTLPFLFFSWAGAFPFLGQYEKGYWADPYTLFWVEIIMMQFAELRRWQVGVGAGAGCRPRAGAGRAAPGAGGALGGGSAPSRQAAQGLEPKPGSCAVAGLCPGVNHTPCLSRARPAFSDPNPKRLLSAGLQEARLHGRAVLPGPGGGVQGLRQPLLPRCVPAGGAGCWAGCRLRAGRRARQRASGGGIQRLIHAPKQTAASRVRHLLCFPLSLPPLPRRCLAPWSSFVTLPHPAPASPSFELY